MAIPEPFDRDWAAAGRTWLGAIGTLVVAGSLLWSAGPLGLLAGGVVAVAWYLLPTPYAVATGHVIALPVLANGPELGVLVALEAGFLAVLAAPMAREPAPLRPLAPTALLAVALGPIAWLGWGTWEPRWLVGLVLVLLVAVGLYGLHRYTVVTLDRRGVELGT